MPGKSRCIYTNDQVQEACAKYPTMKEAAEAMGIESTTFRRWANNGVPRNISDNASSRQSRKEESDHSEGLTMDKILKQHHPVEKFVSAIGTLPRGEFRTDNDMQMCCELSQQAWGRLKRNERSQEYKVRLPDGSLVWGSKQDAAVLRRKLMEA